MSTALPYVLTPYHINVQYLHQKIKGHVLDGERHTLNHRITQDTSISLIKSPFKLP